MQMERRQKKRGAEYLCEEKMRELDQAGKSDAQSQIESLRRENLQFQQLLEKRGQELASLTAQFRSVESNHSERARHYQKVLAEAKAALTEQGAKIGRLVAELSASKVENQALHVPSPHGELGATPALQALHEFVHSIRGSSLSQAELAAPPIQAARELEELKQKIAEREEALRLLKGKLAEKEETIQNSIPKHEVENLVVELDRARGEVANLQQQVQLTNNSDEIEQLKAEVLRLQEELHEMDCKLKVQQALGRSFESDEDAQYEAEMVRYHRELEAERKQLNGFIGDLRRRNAELAQAAEELQQVRSSNNSDQIEQLKAEVVRLREELRDKDRKLKVKQTLAGAFDSAEDAQIAAQYEAEMVRYHRELEAEREQLNGFIGDLRRRNAELARTAEETRQELALDRSKLNSLRDELHVDLLFEDLAFLARKHLAPLRTAKRDK
jgi:chromosome segregation ATPase